MHINQVSSYSTNLDIEQITMAQLLGDMISRPQAGGSTPRLALCFSFPPPSSEPPQPCSLSVLDPLIIHSLLSQAQSHCLGKRIGEETYACYNCSNAGKMLVDLEL